MYKCHSYINAGTNEFYRFGRKAQEKLAFYLNANENGFISVPADGGDYWTFGTSDGKFGEFAKYKDTFFSVNKMGRIWAKEGTEKAEKLVEEVRGLYAGGDLADEDMDAMMHAIQEAYWIAKKKNRKFVPMKYRQNDSEPDVLPE